MKKLFALLLALAMLLSVGAMAETKMPISEEPVKMTMMLGLDTSRGYDPNTNGVFQYLEELTNIDWDYIVVDRTAWQEKLSLTWASGDLPDLIYNGVDSTMLLNYTGKLILDIAPYLEEYAPNFYALYQSNEDVRSAVTLPNGMIGSFAWTNMEIEKGAGECPPEMIYINQTWLETLGLPMPQTLEEYYNTLIAFRDNDPNGNGEKDEIALAPRNAWKDLRLLQPLFGFMADNNTNLYMDGETVRYAPFMDEYKAYVEFWAKLYAEGLIDKDMFVMNNTEVAAKGTVDNTVYGSIITSAAFTVVGADNASHFTPIPVYTAANGNQMWYNRQYASAGVGVITKACKYPELAVQWCDLFFADEYAKLVWMGQEGVAYEYNEDGTWEWIYSEEYPDATAVRAGLTIQPGGQGPSMCPVDWMKLNDATEAPVNAERVYYASEFAGKLRLPMPTLFYEADVAKEMATINTDINAYRDQMLASFITGEASIEAGWEEFIATLKGMGADTIVAYAQAAYDAAK